MFTVSFSDNDVTLDNPTTVDFFGPNVTTLAAAVVYSEGTNPIHFNLARKSDDKSLIGYFYDDRGFRVAVMRETTLVNVPIYVN